MSQETSNHDFDMDIYKGYRRHSADIKIKVLKYKQDVSPLEARLYQYSRGGLYFEALERLSLGSIIYVSPLEPFKPKEPILEDEVQALVKWCQQIQGEKENVFGVGAIFLSRICEKCGESVPAKNIVRMDQGRHLLCEQCLKELETLPEGKFKRSIMRYLKGNVL